MEFSHPVQFWLSDLGNLTVTRGCHHLTRSLFIGFHRSPVLVLTRYFVIPVEFLHRLRPKLLLICLIARDLPSSAPSLLLIFLFCSFLTIFDFLTIVSFLIPKRFFNLIECGVVRMIEPICLLPVSIDPPGTVRLVSAPVKFLQVSFPLA